MIMVDNKNPQQLSLGKTPLCGEFPNIQTSKGKKVRKREEKLSIQKINNVGKWSREEDFIYLNFITKYQDQLSTQSLRRSTKIFKQLSAVLNHSRSSDQCRLHHNKMRMYMLASKKKNIKGIINFLLRKHGFNQEYKKIQNSFKERTENYKNQQYRAAMNQNLFSRSSQTNQRLFHIKTNIQINIRINLPALPKW